MINLRYHVFSLVAVFAALAIGIVVGSTTVKSGLVDNLRGNVQRAEERLAEIEQENADLAARAGQIDLLDTEGPALLDGQLTGRPVLWLTAPGVGDSVVDGLDAAVEAAGGISIGRVAIEDAVFGEDAADALVAALDRPTADVDGDGDVDDDDLRTLRNEMGSELAIRLDAAALLLESPVAEAPETDVPDVRETDVPETDVPTTDASTTEGAAPDSTVTTAAGSEGIAADAAPLGPSTTASTSTTTTTTLPPPPALVGTTLRDQLSDWEDLGLVDLRDLSSLSVTPGAAVHVVAVVDRRSSIDAAAVMLPALTVLGDAVADTVAATDDRSEPAERVIVVAEAGVDGGAIEDGTPASLVDQVRRSGRLRDEMSTVDNAEQFPGWAAVVLALRNGDAGERGDYGYRARSDSLLPAPLP